MARFAPFSIQGGTLLWVLLCGLLLFAAGRAGAQNQPVELSARGVSLGVQYTDGSVQDLRFTVLVGDDVVDSAHVWALIGGSERRQRTENGFWAPWDGAPETLIDNHFPVKDGQIFYKILDEDIGDDNHGVTLVIGYKTGGVLKLGYFGLLPNGAP